MSDKDKALHALAGCLAMAARYAEGRQTGVLNEVRHAYRAWAATQPGDNPRPPFCNMDDWAVLRGEFDTTHEAFTARMGNP